MSDQAISPENSAQTPYNELLATIAEIEQLVVMRRYDALFDPLKKTLEKLEGQFWRFGGMDAMSDKAQEDATRLASALTQWITDPDYRMNRNFFYMICGFKRVWGQIFEVSGFCGTEHFITIFSGRINGRKKAEITHEIPKLLAAVSINVMNTSLLSLMMEMEKSLSFVLMLGFLSEQMLYRIEAEAMRAELIRKFPVWQNKAGPNMTAFRGIAPAYMGCSYAVTPDKHDIKYALNSVVRQIAAQQGVTEKALPAKRVLKERPRIVIMAEFYAEIHAMHRCYGPSIAALKQRFHTILMMEEGNITNNLRAMVDEVVPMTSGPQGALDLIPKIQALEPDILYMPSVGMRITSITASNYRLAPIQIMTFGHPATTHSNKMDYVVIEEDLGRDPSTISETVILRPREAHYTHRSDAADIAPDIRLNPETIRIAVPAWSRKITPEFLLTCKKIKEKAKRPVEFWFFPNSSGTLHQALERRYLQIVPGKLFPRAGYNVYIQNLNACDIFLSSFPFGATNGILDASFQGIPIVNLKGPEVHSINDACMVKRLHQPDWLSAETIEDYIDAVVRLAEDDALRVQISRNILDGNPKEALLIAPGEVAENMVDIFEGLYHLHEDIQASKAHVVDHRTLKAALAEKRKKNGAPLDMKAFAVHR